METVILAGQDFDYGDFREIPFSSSQTLFDFELVLWDLRWLCFSYRFETLEREPGWAEPKRLVFDKGLKQKILRDRERRISEIEHLMDRGGALVIMISTPIIYSFYEDMLDGDNTTQVFDNYSFLPPAIEKPIRDLLVEGSGRKIEFKGNKVLLPAWNKIKHVSLYSAYFTSSIGDPFLYIKDTNYSVGSWFSYRKGQVFLIPHTPDDGGDDYPAFIEAAKQLVNIVRTKIPNKNVSLPKVKKKEAKPLISKQKLPTQGNISVEIAPVSFSVEPALKLARPLRVFLCHATQDKPDVRKLYRQLNSESIDAWLDEEKLRPGQNWRFEIPRAVRSSDVIIVCLSKNSISKEGFVQSEIKTALDAATEKPEGTIFIIPLRLQECEVPESLRHLQWVNYFEDKGVERLLHSLRERADSLGLSKVEK